jgi:hypothetical protein
MSGSPPHDGTKSPSGGYEVRPIKKEGSELHVLVSSWSKVTGTQTGLPAGAPPTDANASVRQLDVDCHVVLAGASPSRLRATGSAATSGLSLRVRDLDLALEDLPRR